MKHNPSVEALAVSIRLRLTSRRKLASEALDDVRHEHVSIRLRLTSRRKQPGVTRSPAPGSARFRPPPADQPEETEVAPVVAQVLNLPSASGSPAGGNGFFLRAGGRLP